MIYNVQPAAIIIFVVFVLFVIGLSFYLGNKTKSSEGYFAAGGTIPWGVNGIAFAGDYLSAASFLGICAMIAMTGYDGFLYSIGYLAGWVVALFVVAEPMKRLGKYTFTDALDSKFNSKGIQLMAAISTLIVSMCYLIPQMVGAGSLVTPLLGLEQYWGVIIVGIVVILIVATAGMASTTYVQFMKGGLLIIFSTVLVFYLLKHGFTLDPSSDNNNYKAPVEMSAVVAEDGKVSSVGVEGFKILAQKEEKGKTFLKLSREEEYKIDGKAQKGTINTWWLLSKNEEGKPILKSTLSVTKLDGGKVVHYNGAVKEAGLFHSIGSFHKLVVNGKEVEKTGGLNPFNFLSIIEESEMNIYKKLTFKDGKNTVTLNYPVVVSGKTLMKPGVKFKVASKNWMDKLNFISLMLALFFGTSALPHILIRYYTVPSQAAARKSTILAIAAIGFFYVLTKYMGFGAMVNGVIDVSDTNMSAPLLAKYFYVVLFAIISAIAFATVLGTVSGLIVAASGAVAHDLMSNYLNIQLTDGGKVKAGKIAAIVVGIIAIALGIAFKGVNVSFLVGWAFAVAASANLPAILMLLFWKKTTAKGIAASILVGMVSALAIILISPTMCENYMKWWGWAVKAPFGLNNPGIVSIPLAFITLVIISLMTQPKDTGTTSESEENKEAPASA